MWKAVLLLSLLSLPISIASDLKAPKVENIKTAAPHQIPNGTQAAAWAQATRWMGSSGFSPYLPSLRFDGSKPVANGLYQDFFSFFDSGAWREISEFTEGGKNPEPVGSPAILGASSFVQVPSSKPDLSPLPVSSALQEAVEMWAQAWCSSSSQSLTSEMADPDPSAYFQAENLGTLENASILWAGKERDGNGLAQAKITVEAKRKDPVSFQLLLLIENPGAGDPKVTDWGPTGCASVLSPYAKALSSQDIHQWNL